MNDRRFTNIRVSKRVRVMSDGHYWFRVFMDGGPARDYSPDSGFEALESATLQAGWTAPKYVTAATDAAIVTLLRSGEAVFYEHDRDGIARYEPHLRYHDPEIVAWWAYHLTR